MATGMLLLLAAALVVALLHATLARAQMCRMPDPVVSEEDLDRDTTGMTAEQLTTHAIKVAERGRLAHALPLPVDALFSERAG